MAQREYLGTYRLVSEIRAGKTCVVYDVANDSTGERLAIKLLAGEAAPTAKKSAISSTNTKSAGTWTIPTLLRSGTSAASGTHSIS